jgi:hypothetical protein
MDNPEYIKKFHSEEIMNEIKQKLELLTSTDKRHLIKHIKKTIEIDKLIIEGGGVVISRDCKVSFNF